MLVPAITKSKGIQYMLFATLLFSVMQVFVKQLSYIPFYELIFFRAVVSFVLCVFTIHSQGLKLFGNNKKLLLLRGLFGVASLSCFFYALQHVPLGSTVTIVNIKPFLILLIGSLVLKESLRWQQVLYFLISFIGILVIKGFDERISMLGLFAVLGAAVFAAIAHTIVRLLRNYDKPVVILFYFTLITLPFALPLTVLNWVSPIGWDWVKAVSLGVITHFAQLFLTKAYQSEKVASVSNLYYLGIVFAICFGYYFFDEKYSWQALLGIGIILLGIVLNLHFTAKRSNY